MRSITSADAKNNFGELIDLAPGRARHGHQVRSSRDRGRLANREDGPFEGRDLDELGRRTGSN